MSYSWRIASAFKKDKINISINQIDIFFLRLFLLVAAKGLEQVEVNAHSNNAVAESEGIPLQKITTIRIGLALSTTGWIQENVVEKFFKKRMGIIARIKIGARTRMLEMLYTTSR